MGRILRTQEARAWALVTTNYERGRAFEYRVRDDMRSRGYWAQRSPRSGTSVDVFACHAGIVFFIQAKRDGRISRIEISELRYLAGKHRAMPIFARPEKIKGKRRSGLVYKLLTDGSPFVPPKVK